MKDLIDRKAVLKIINDELEYSDNVYATLKCITIRRAVNDLPSAQPERTCVNCSRTANNGGWYADGGTRCPIEEHYALPKDGYCHLWEEEAYEVDLSR